jgi:hypothetical protein
MRAALRDLYQPLGIRDQLLIKIGLHMGPALRQLAIDSGRLFGGRQRVLATTQRAVTGESVQADLGPRLVDDGLAKRTGKQASSST